MLQLVCRDLHIGRFGDQGGRVTPPESWVYNHETSNHKGVRFGAEHGEEIEMIAIAVGAALGFAIFVAMLFGAIAPGWL